MAFLTLISAGPNNWNALVPDLTCIVTAKTREDLVERARESIALALEDQPREPQAQGLQDVDPEIRAELPTDIEVAHLDPAPLNPVSGEIERALGRAGINQSELARRLGTSRSAVSRLVNPFYWGHSLDILRRVAEAVDADLSVHLTAKAS
ncbi:hypothetical protein GCM10008955_42050 [Deinococcus malanensis]|uniref:HTH cro/C1-type domain-containing protein n=1 Tax=Deinococcus malanensis TaxID=1706855 RepID=A0ABQ2F5C9_9DEIO|nr:helix-turn-helix transcriptional regulator [Deinococcus malanensis]GGK43862.1 hypothetical protein GCM10008955_42050 [Deinococcus malanensis]